MKPKDTPLPQQQRDYGDTFSAFETVTGHPPMTDQSAADFEKANQQAFKAAIDRFTHLFKIESATWSELVVHAVAAYREAMEGAGYIMQPSAADRIAAAPVAYLLSGTGGNPFPTFNTVEAAQDWAEHMRITNPTVTAIALVPLTEKEVSQ